MRTKRVTFECPIQVVERVEKFIEKENQINASTGFKLTIRHFLISAIDFYLQNKNKV